MLDTKIIKYETMTGH